MSLACNQLAQASRAHEIGHQLRGVRRSTTASFPASSTVFATQSSQRIFRVLSTSSTARNYRQHPQKRK